MENKEAIKTINTFPRKVLHTETGCAGQYGINLTTEFTMLIKEAANCNYYASDLLYGIESINKAVEAGEEYTEYFGFRDMGVDHESFINSRLGNPGCYGSIAKEYRRIVCMEIVHDDYYKDGIKVTTYEVEFK